MIVETLKWYAKQAKNCRKISTEGDIAREELDNDGGERAQAALEVAQWQPVETLPCDDTYVIMYHNTGRMFIEDCDHDSTPEYWANYGVTHWMPVPKPPEEEV